MNPNLSSNEQDERAVWRFFSQWPTIISVSIVVLVLTLNPLLTGILPYLRAGWPALRTAFWLKKSDPWKARGTVGFLFHLCLALFRAGICAFICVLSTAFFSSMIQKEAHLTTLMIAILTILLGCFMSSIIGWIGIVIALRNRVRIFVMSNLHSICRGDFTVAKTLGTGRNGTNPGNYVIAVVTSSSLFAIWFVAMLISVPPQVNGENKTALFILLCLLPVLVITCVILVDFLSKRIMAKSPAECWGVEAPESNKDPANWYQSAD